MAIILSRNCKYLSQYGAMLTFSSFENILFPPFFYNFCLDEILFSTTAQYSIDYLHPSRSYISPYPPLMCLLIPSFIHLSMPCHPVLVCLM